MGRWRGNENKCSTAGSSYIITYTGKRFDIPCPSIDQICLEDIAHALSQQCRFNGHTSHMWSVAAHSILVHDIAKSEKEEDDVLAACLFHDAAEAYIGDIVTPLKQCIPEIGAVESGILRTIAIKYGIDFNSHKDRIKQYDLRALAAEKKAFLNTTDKWECLKGIENKFNDDITINAYLMDYISTKQRTIALDSRRTKEVFLELARRYI